jgi:hypothetical protein
MLSGQFRDSSRGNVAFGDPLAFNGVKVFSATMMADRDQLGEKITSWLESHPGFQIRDMVVTQSSDEAFHCLAITIFYWEDLDR